MLKKINLMWASQSRLDIALVVLSCVTIAALYAAFLM